MRRSLTWVLGLSVLLSGCSLWPQPSTPPPVIAPVVAGRTQVEGANGAVVGLSVSAVPLGRKELADLSGWGDFPMAVGKPSEIRRDRPIPAEGLRITRRFERALPKGASATLAYFNTEMDSWVAVPSSVAPDGKSVSAVVHHLSWWTDFVSGTQAVMKSIGDAAAGTADWAYYYVGKVFDTRVDPPKCSSKNPGWVDTATFIETHRNNPILFCVGRDEAKPELLVIKARVNRGLGFTAETATKPTWSYNSTFERNELQAAWTTLAEIDKVLADSVRNLTSDGRMTAPGQEFSIGLSEAEAGKEKTFRVLKMTPQPVLPFLGTLLAQLVGTDLTLKVDGYVAAAMVLAKCSKDVSAVSDGGSLAKAALSCVGGLDETVARQLATYLLKRGVKDPGKLAGSIVGKASVYLAAIGPVFNAMNYFAEQFLTESATTVHVFPAITKVLLAPRKVGQFKFGTDYKTVEKDLRRILGKPDTVTEDEGCPMDPIWARTLQWKGLWVGFEATQPTKTDKMVLASWSIRNGTGLPIGVRTVDSLPAKTTFKELRRIYPGITIYDMFNTGSGPFLSELKIDASYFWTDRQGSAVFELKSGPVRGCE